MSDPAPCRHEPELFNSPKRADHLEARELCVRCPLASRCRALVDRNATGTYGGHLFKLGELVNVA